MNNNKRINRINRALLVICDDETDAGLMAKSRADHVGTIPVQIKTWIQLGDSYRYDTSNGDCGVGGGTGCGSCHDDGGDSCGGGYGVGGGDCRGGRDGGGDDGSCNDDNVNYGGGDDGGGDGDGGKDGGGDDGGCSNRGGDANHGGGCDGRSGVDDGDDGRGGGDLAGVVRDGSQ